MVERYRAVTLEHLPWVVEELDGAAAGAGLDPLAVFAASIEELAPAEAPTGCSDLVVTGARTADGHLLVAHTNDLYAEDEDGIVAIEWRVPGQPVAFTLGTGPWISVGWNDAGLSVTGNEVSPNDERVGIPRPAAGARRALAPDARRSGGRQPAPRPRSAYNWVLAHSDGLAANVEASATSAGIDEPGADGFLVHTNHYAREDMRGFERAGDYESSCAARPCAGSGGRRRLHRRAPPRDPLRPRERPERHLPPRRRAQGREDGLLVRRRRHRRRDHVRPRQPLRLGGPGLPLRRVTGATLFGRPLPEGGTIGVAAPASPFESRSTSCEASSGGVPGYRVKLAEHVLARDDYLAGDARDRAADLAALFADPEVDVVQCLQGGYGSAEVLPFLDFDVIAANPKPFVGFSDITALHVAIRQRTGLATFYGNGLLGMGDTETTSFSKERLLDVLRGNGAGKVPDNPDDPYVRPIRGGKATAPLVGGCLSLLIRPWARRELDLDGTILFFEDVDLEPYRADAILTQLAQPANWPVVRGVVVGEMEKSDWGDHPGWPRTRLSRTCSRCTWSRWVSLCYTSFPLGTGSTSRPSRSASPRRSMRTRGRSRSISPA